MYGSYFSSRAKKRGDGLNGSDHHRLMIIDGLMTGWVSRLVTRRAHPVEMRCRFQYAGKLTVALESCMQFSRVIEWHNDCFVLYISRER